MLDLFGGSGTTMIAAERTGRRARLLELDLMYADVVVERWQAFTGAEATLLATGQTFAQTAMQRRLVPALPGAAEKENLHDPL